MCLFGCNCQEYIKETTSRVHYICKHNATAPRILEQYGLTNLVLYNSLRFANVSLESIRIAWRLEAAIAMAIGSPCIPLNIDFNIVWKEAIQSTLIDQTKLFMLAIDKIPQSLAL
jgi:hypothetical protein